AVSKSVSLALTVTVVSVWSGKISSRTTLPPPPPTLPEALMTDLPDGQVTVTLFAVAELFTDVFALLMTPVMVDGVVVAAVAPSAAPRPVATSTPAAMARYILRMTPSPWSSDSGLPWMTAAPGLRQPSLPFLHRGMTIHRDTCPARPRRRAQHGRPGPRLPERDHLPKSAGSRRVSAVAGIRPEWETT